MSSFRIDRQYVAFETAETQPVFAANNVQKPKPVSSNDVHENGINALGNNAAGMDVSKLYNEIYEKLQSEHAEQAEYMLSKAADEAQDIIDKAKKNAEEIIGQARADTERMRGELTGAMEAASSERKRQAETELIDLETKLRNDYTNLVDEMNSDVIGLVMEIVKKIIGIKLLQSDEIFVGIIRDALERLKQTGSVVIRISPEDYIRYFGSERSDLVNNALREIQESGEIRMTVAEDPNLSNGDLVVESEGEMIDLSINRQIDLIEKAFLN